MGRTKSTYTKTGEKRSKGGVAKAPRNSTSSKKATKAFILKNAVKDDKGELVEQKSESMSLDGYCKEPEVETSDIHKPGSSDSSKNQEMVHMDADQIESDIEDESANGDETESRDKSTDSVAENIEQECVLIDLCTSDEEEDKNSFAENFQGNREAVPAEAKSKENLVSEDDKAKEVVPAKDEQEENILTNDDKEVVPAKDEQEENILTNDDNEKEVVPAKDEQEEYMVTNDDEKQVVPAKDEQEEYMVTNDDEKEVVPEKDEQEENIITNEDKEKEAVPAEAECEDDKENKFGVKPKKEASCNGEEVIDTE